MKNIWKFVLPIQDRTTIEMPAHAQILAVQMQHEQPCLWALVDPSNEPESRTIVIVGTGHPIGAPTMLVHLGTFQAAGGAFVGHVFEDTR